MEDGYRIYEDKELPISIKDLLLRICLRWRRIIAMALVMAILFNALGIVKSYKAVLEQQRTEVISEEEKFENSKKKALNEMEKAKAELSNREVEEVDRAVETYKQVLPRYNGALSYVDKSALMKLNPEAIDTVIIAYTVDNHYSVEYPIIAKKDNTGAILSAIQSYAMSDDLCRQIADKMEEKIEASFVKELISVQLSTDTIRITMYTLSETDCEIVAEVINNELNKYCAKLVSVFGDFDFKKVSESIGKTSDVEVMNDQTTQFVNINNLKGVFNNLLGAMTEGQKQYYFKQLDYFSVENNKPETVEKEETVGSTHEQGELINTSISFVHTKYILLGVLLGIFFTCGWIVVVYIFSGKLHITDDIEGYFGVPVVGMIEENKSKSKIDMLIRELLGDRNGYSEEDNLKITCANIRITASKQNCKKIYITGSGNDERTMDYLTKISQGIKGDFEEVLYGGSVVYDMESLERLSQSDCVVFVERINNSKYLNIKKELEKCSMNKINVLGCVVLE